MATFVKPLQDFQLNSPKQRRVRRFTRANCAPELSLGPSYDSVEHSVRAFGWEDSKCELSSVLRIKDESRARELRFQVKGIPNDDEAILLITHISPHLEISMPYHNSSNKYPLTLLHLSNGDEFSILATGSGQFELFLFSSASMRIGFQREFAIASPSKVHGFQKLFSKACKKARQGERFPDILCHVIDPSRTLRTMYITDSGLHAFSKDGLRTFFTYWDSISNIQIVSKKYIDVQLGEAEQRFNCPHVKFIHYCLTHFCSKYKYAQKIQVPIHKDALHLLYDFGF